MEATSHRSQCYDVYLFQVPVIDEGLRYLLFKAQYLNPLEVVLKWWWLSGTVVKYSSLEGCITAWCQRRLQRCQISPVAPTVLGAASQSVVSPAGWYFRCVQIMQKNTLQIIITPESSSSCTLSPGAPVSFLSFFLQLCLASELLLSDLSCHSLLVTSHHFCQYSCGQHLSASCFSSCCIDSLRSSPR